MKVTTRRWQQQGIQPLWDVLIDGQVIGDGRHGWSAGRVLQMGKLFLPVLDTRPQAFTPTFRSRADAAAFVARLATQEV